MVYQGYLTPGFYIPMHRGLSEVINARVLYIDMNSFFASVEQEFNPALRSKPVAVCSHTTNKGTVLAASYEAKALGIKTGMKVGDARGIFPKLHVCEPTANRYKQVHIQIMNLLRQHCGPEVQVRSIDEAAVFLSKNWQDPAFAHAMALRLKEAIAREVGSCITCSIGIAPNSLLAKLATDLKKPNGLVTITKENLREVLGSIQLTDLPGIAGRNALRLAAKNIYTPLQLADTPFAELVALFGIWGASWWWRLHGYEPDAYWNSSPMKTMSHEHVLEKWLRGHDAVVPSVRTMADRLVHRLRKNQFNCTGVGISLRLVDLPAIWRERKFDAPVADYPTLVSTLIQLTNSIPLQDDTVVRKISVHCWGLHQASSGVQLDLFQTVAPKEQISASVEKIRSRYGFASIQPASNLLRKRIGDEQLGFGRIKDRAEASALSARA